MVRTGDRGAVTRYATVLFDLDHTLLDSETSMAAAYEHTMHGIGIDDPWPLHPVFERINRALWDAVERHEISPEEVRFARFTQFLDELRLDADPVAMAEQYVEQLGASGDLFEGVIDVLDALRPHVSLALITNGIGQVQRARIARLGLEPYFEAVVISGEVGAAKPGTGIFDLVFDALGTPDRRGAVIVGDSLSSDIRGGANYGIDTVWYNPEAKPVPADMTVTHVIGDLHELVDLVLGAKEPA